jgi:hypothetical protein
MADLFEYFAAEQLRSAKDRQPGHVLERIRLSKKDNSISAFQKTLTAMRSDEK